jgi:hypothetical protein
MTVEQVLVGVDDATKIEAHVAPHDHDITLWFGDDLSIGVVGSATFGVQRRLLLDLLLKAVVAVAGVEQPGGYREDDGPRVTLTDFDYGVATPASIVVDGRGYLTTPRDGIHYFLPPNQDPTPGPGPAQPPVHPPGPVEPEVSATADNGDDDVWVTSPVKLPSADPSAATVERPAETPGLTDLMLTPPGIASPTPDPPLFAAIRADRPLAAAVEGRPLAEVEPTVKRPRRARSKVPVVAQSEEPECETPRDTRADWCVKFRTCPLCIIESGNRQSFMSEDRLGAHIQVDHGGQLAIDGRYVCSCGHIAARPGLIAQHTAAIRPLHAKARHRLVSQPPATFVR